MPPGDGTSKVDVGQILVLLGELKGQIGSFQMTLAAQAERINKQDEDIDRLRNQLFKAIADHQKVETDRHEKLDRQVNKLGTRQAVMWAVAIVAFAFIEFALKFVNIGAMS